MIKPFRKATSVINKRLKSLESMSSNFEKILYRKKLLNLDERGVAIQV
jgi:hypothetical protein